MSTPPTDAARRGLWPRLALLLGLAAAVTAFYALGLHRYLSWEAVRDNLDGWRAQAREHLVIAAAAYFVAYVAVTALSLPAATVLSLLGGAVFDWSAVALVSVASTTGATLAMLSSRYLLRDWVRRRFGARLAAIDRGVEQDGAFYLFTLRLTPVVPFWLINLGMGLTPMKARTFAAVSWLGMLPATVVFVNAGRALQQIKGPADVLSPGVLASLALLGVAPLVIRLLVRWWQAARGRVDRGGGMR